MQLSLRRCCWLGRIASTSLPIVAIGGFALLASTGWAQAAEQSGPDSGVAPTLLMDRAEIRVYRVVLQPGAVRSVHSHDDVAYHVWIPIEGTPELTVGADPAVPAAPGDAFFLERGTTHGFRNPATTPAEIIEVFVYGSSAVSRDALWSSFAATFVGSATAVTP